MSKRSAQGPQGDKTTMGEFHMASTPDDKPQRATAAQMANRKIKEVRKRGRATTPTSGAGASFGGAFSSVEAPETSFSSAPSFGSNTFASGSFAPPNQSTGFTFGQSQSFPGAGSTSNQPQQDGPTAFAFGGSSQPGFSFSSSPSFGSSTSNPFAVNTSFTNGHSGDQPTSTGGFTGFGGSSFNAPSSQAQSTPQTFSSGLFGTQQTSSAPASTGLFGQSATTVTAAGSTNDSMQTSPDAKPKTNNFTSTPGFQNRNLFGGAGAPSLTPSQPATPSSNPFGNLGVPPKSDKAPADKDVGFAAKPAEAQPFKSLFGTATPKASEPEKTQPNQPASSNIFAPKTATSQGGPSNLFAPKTATEQAAPSHPFTSQPAAEQGPAKTAETQSFKPLFPATPSSSESSTQPPSSNLFLPKPAAEAQPFSSLFAKTPSTSKPTEPAQAAQTATSNIFAPKTSAEQNSAKPAETQPFSSLFGGTSKPQTSEPEKSSQPASANIFAPKSTAGQTSATAAQPFASLLTPSTATRSEPEKVQPSQPATTNLFTPKPTAEQASVTPFPTQPSSGLLEAKSSTAGVSALEKPQPSPSAPNNTFTPKPAVEKAATEATSTLTQPSGVSGMAATRFMMPGASYYESHYNIPRPEVALAENPKLREDVEFLDRVRTLNGAFRCALLSRSYLNDSFDEVVLYYLRCRESMGIPIANVTLQDTTATATSLSTQGPAEAASEDDSATANAFAHSYSSPKPGSAKQTGAAPSQPTTALPPTTQAAAPNFANNMFANRGSGVNTSTATTTPSQAGPSRASAAAQSTAPAPAIPKFGSGSSATDFMAQFKQQAEKNMAKEKAKRKAEEFDSDEDDEAEWERQDAERQRERRAKFETGAAKKRAKFVPGRGFMFVDDDEAPASPAPTSDQCAITSDTANVDKVNEANKTGTTTPASSIFESAAQPVPSSENIFGRLSATPQPAGNPGDGDSSGDERPASARKRRASNDEESNDDDGHRESKRVTKASDIAKSKSSLDTPIPAPTQAAGRSLFERISTPPSRQEDANPAISQPFASNPFAAAPRVSSPFNQSTQNTSSPFRSDNSDPIHFGANYSSGIGTANLFGNRQNSPKKDSSSGISTPAPFGASQTAPGDQTWKPNTPIKFAADSAPVTSSENATPADTATPAEPASDDQEGESGAIFDLTRGNAGEEEEEVVYESRARAFKLVDGRWSGKGAGVVRLLRHPANLSARLVLRAEPGGNVILNTLLKRELDYVKAGDSVQFVVLAKQDAGQWAIRVKAQNVDLLYAKMQEVKN